MGSMTFVRADDSRKVSFDSSPQYSLSKQFGWSADTMQLEEQRRDENVIVYTVRAGSMDSSPVRVVGTLFQKTQAAIRRELARR